MKKFRFVFVLAFLIALLLPVAAAPVPIAAPNFPSQSIIQGDLTLHLDMPSLDEKLAPMDQQLATLEKKIDALGHGEGLIVLLGLLNLGGILVTLGLLIIRTKVLNALGLSKIAEADKPSAPPGTGSAGAKT